MSFSTATGMVFEEDSMSGYRCLWDDTYVENPERFKRVLQRCRELGLVDRCLQIKPRKSVEFVFLTLFSFLLLLLLLQFFLLLLLLLFLLRFLLLLLFLLLQLLLVYFVLLLLLLHFLLLLL